MKKERVYLAALTVLAGILLIAGSLIMVANGTDAPRLFIFVIGVACFPLAIRILWPT